MFRLLRMLSVCFLAVTIVSIAAAQEGANSIVQRSSVTITATAIGDRIRITAPASIVEMHVEVYAAGGEKLFDREIRGGNVFDWNLQNGQAQRLAPGTYVCVVTAKGISGKLTQRIGTVNVEEKSVSLQVADSRQLSAVQAQPIGPVEENSSWTIAGNDEPQTPTVIANDGTDGQMIRGRGALTFRIGNFFSGIDTEQMRLTEAGDLGIGTSEPKAKLEVAGTIRAKRFLVAKPRQTSNATGDPGQTTDDAGSVQPLVAGTGTQNQIAKWIDNSATLGNSGITETATGVGIGTAAPTQALDVANGRIVTTGSQALAGSSDSMIEVKSTVTNNGLGQSAIKARNIFNGSGDFVTGIDVAPTFAPSASISTAQGFVAAASFAPPPGVTITNALGGASATVYANVSGGAVTNGAAFNIVSPFVFGPLKPANQYGLRINNQGIAGTSNSYGLFVDAQSGSTNNFSAIFAGGNVGIGTTTPAAPLDIQKEGNVPTLLTTSYGSSNVLLGRAAGGTRAAPTATISQQTLLQFGGAGHTGTGFTGNRAIMIFQASETWTGSAQGTFIRFLTTESGTFSTAERMRIGNDGNVGIGTATPGNPLDVLGIGTNNGGFSGFNTVVAHFKQATASQGAAVSIDAPSGQSPILHLAEEGVPKWTIRNQSTNDILLIRDGANHNRLSIDSNGTVGIGGNVVMQSNLNVAGAFTVHSFDIEQLTVRDHFYFNPKANAGTFDVCMDAVAGLSGAYELGFCSSSIRYKTNVQPFNAGLNLINRLRPVSFNWKSDSRADFGLIAEEVAAVEPLLSTHNDKGEIQGVKYDRVGVVLVNAVNELKAEKDAQISALKSESEAWKTQIAALKSENVALCHQKSAIEARLTTLESKFKKKPATTRPAARRPRRGGDVIRPLASVRI